MDTIAAFGSALLSMNALLSAAPAAFPSERSVRLLDRARADGIVTVCAYLVARALACVLVSLLPALGLEFALPVLIAALCFGCSVLAARLLESGSVEFCAAAVFILVLFGVNAQHGIFGTLGMAAGYYLVLLASAACYQRLRLSHGLGSPRARLLLVLGLAACACSAAG